MNTFHRTFEFDDWLSALKDRIGKARVVQRLDSAAAGNFGDCEPVGEAVSEMRVHVGPRCRVYFTRIDEVTCSAFGSRLKSIVFMRLSGVVSVQRR